MAGDTATPPTSTCAITGEETTGKVYILKTTEGEELVSPEGLFHNGADHKLARILANLTRRVQLLEDEVSGKSDGQEQKDDKTAAGREEDGGQAAKKTAAKEAD